MRSALVALFCVGIVTTAGAQTAVSEPQREQREKSNQQAEKAQNKAAQRSTAIDFRGEKSFADKDLRTALNYQIRTIDQYGLTPAREDDVACFLELSYRTHAYAKLHVHYS